MIITVMLTLMVTLIVTALVTTMAQYVKWQFYTLGQPLYSLILWHALLFSIILAVFYDSRRGFKTTLHLLSQILYRAERHRHKHSLEYRMYTYQEHAKKVSSKTILLPLIFTISLALLILSQTLFFTVITTDSMAPTFEPGDLVLMQNFHVNPKPGDILLFDVPGQPMPIAHRVYSISDNSIRTKGDANPVVDVWLLKPEQIRGKAVFLGGQPVVLRGAGKYFVVDARARQAYGPEYNAMAKLIRGIKSAGLVIFAASLLLYLILSLRAMRRTQHQCSCKHTRQT